MESYRGIYEMKFENKVMYTWVYVTPENIQINIHDILVKLVGANFCLHHEEPLAGVNIEGWTGIHIDIQKQELEVIIYNNYNSNCKNKPPLFKKTFPFSKAISL